MCHTRPKSLCASAIRRADVLTSGVARSSNFPRQSLNVLRQSGIK